ncbi:uracil-DNA glycosylase isoform X2 [Parasteatoda tepidariorum]|uniref:uracil-DNA glycosylase isoform X2 n=1 Tax=Parasteatoda tepidariorum TaxID=114398 RepID=UPI001C72229B|nr:uracil-DNA glycosylase isoform X2 [Parasteatoda tepidariorum]
MRKTPAKIPKVVTTKKVPTEILSFSLDSSDNSPKNVEYVVGKTWLKELKKEFSADYFKKLSEFLIKQKLQHTVYPPTCDIFSWTTSVTIYDVKVVILGQDPYIRPEQAHGVLLLNTCLTVQAGISDSHKGQGWELFTDAVIKWINENLKHVVFMLWGNNAKKKSELINKKKHLVLTAAHPSPLSAHRGFFGCNHFFKANEYLQEHGRGEIDWTYLP